jgi:hypothetical protein
MRVQRFLSLLFSNIMVLPIQVFKSATQLLLALNTTGCLTKGLATDFGICCISTGICRYADICETGLVDKYRTSI